MKNTMGIILMGGNNSRLKDLSMKRTSSAIPIGGKYRAVDFVLSNMVNSGITNVGVLTQYSFRSLMDHLGSGKEWDLDRKKQGLFIFPPYLSDEGSGWYRGSADAMYNNLSFLRRSDEDHVIIAMGNCVYNMTYDAMLEEHIRTGADITVAYTDVSGFSMEERALMGIVDVNEDGRIVDFQEKPLHPKTTYGSMAVYLVRRELLMSLIEDCAAHGNYDFVRDVLIKKVNDLHIHGYKFDGFWRPLSSIQLYYSTNMDMLQNETRQELFCGPNRIFTKVKDEAPAKYNSEAEVRNSIIADGCFIEGTVENSVLFRGVTVKRGVVIRNSIVMQDAVIDENSNLENVILDKGVVVTREKHLKGDVNWPIIVSKNVVV